MMELSEARWYAVRVKSNREKVTAQALRGRNLDVCLPLYRESRTRGDSTRTVELPLFAGYVFSCFDSRNRLPVLTVPGVVHIVGFGTEPEPVDPLEIASLRKVVESRLHANPHPYLPVGHRVQIRTGPLRGAEGVIVAHRNETTLVVSVTLLQRSVAVAMEREWLDGIAPHRVLSVI
jgi:transcription antitermination factor NusG